MNAMVATHTTACQSKAKRPRLVADPRVTADDIAEVYHMYCAWKGDKDIYGLVCPPSSGPRTLAWSSKPHAAYMAKLSGLMFDMVKLAPNGKIASSRNVAGLRCLLEKNVIVNNIQGKSSASFLDSIDSMVRILLGMYREVKRDEKNQESVYPRTMRACSRAERNRIQLVLDRMKLPDSYEDTECGDDGRSEDEDEPCYSSEDYSTNGGAAIVPIGEGKKFRQTSMELHDSASGVKAFGFPTAGLALTIGVGKGMGGGGVGKDMGGGKGVLGFPYGGLGSPAAAKHHVVDDADDDDDNDESDKDDIKSLLAEAAEFVPREVREPAKKPAGKIIKGEKKKKKTTKVSCIVYICTL